MVLQASCWNLETAKVPFFCVHSRLWNSPWTVFVTTTIDLLVFEVPSENLETIKALVSKLRGQGYLMACHPFWMWRCDSAAVQCRGGFGQVGLLATTNSWKVCLTPWTPPPPIPPPPKKAVLKQFFYITRKYNQYVIACLNCFFLWRIFKWSLYHSILMSNESEFKKRAYVGLRMFNRESWKSDRGTSKNIPAMEQCLREDAM